MSSTEPLNQFQILPSFIIFENANGSNSHIFNIISKNIYHVYILYNKDGGIYDNHVIQTKVLSMLLD